MKMIILLKYLTSSVYAIQNHICMYEKKQQTDIEREVYIMTAYKIFISYSKMSLTKRYWKYWLTSCYSHLEA